MADQTGTAENEIWPIPQFYFRVTWGSATIHFSEVSGLDNKDAVIEYRHGDSKEFSPIKMPGLGKVGNVTMKRGLYVGHPALSDWISEIRANPGTVTIELLNERGKPTMAWELRKAWPTKITSPDLKAGSNEVAIETMEIAFETITIKDNDSAGD